MSPLSMPIDSCISGLAEVDWSRTNRDWFGMIGIAEQNPDGSSLLDEQGRERVVITGGKGDQGLRKAIAYLRKKTPLKTERAKTDPAAFEENRVEAEEAA